MLFKFARWKIFKKILFVLKMASLLLCIESNYKAPSNSNRNRFVFNPPPYPPILPSLAITRWHGIIIGKGLFAFAFPTALDAFGFPVSIAINLYEAVFPYGIFSTFFKTLSC